jgi:hypothetical protein
LTAFNGTPGAAHGDGIAERKLAGVGEAGFQRGAGLAVDHRHFEAGLAQVPRAGGSDHAAAEHQHPHLARLRFGNIPCIRRQGKRCRKYMNAQAGEFPNCRGI